MYCPKCGKENPEGAGVCSACSSPLPGASAPAERPITKTSGLAIAAFVLGILSLWCFGITAIPAVILAIVSLITIERSGGRLTGKGFAIVGIVVPVVVFFLMLGMLIPVLRHARHRAVRTTCGANLMGIGKAMIIYSNDYQDEFPRAGGSGTIWQPKINNWKASDRFTAYNLHADSTGGQASISASFYLLVKYAEVTPKSFVCKGNRRTKEFKPQKYLRDKELTKLWDFGPEPWKHCSYAYHIPYGLYALTTSSEPGMAVAADRNPWIASPAAEAKKIMRFNPNGTLKQQKYGNSISHQEDGQNVLFMDGHAYFEKRAFCAINDDNIYTYWGGGDIRRGRPPVIGSLPLDKRDSLLVHDPPGRAGR